MLFKILYSIFLIVSLFYGSVPILGSLSVRHILTIIMLGACYFEGGLKLDRFLKWYMGFLLIYVIVEAGSGYSSYVFGKILGTYLASIVLYMATKVLIEKYEAGHLIITILVVLGVINAIEAIGQFFGNPIAQILPEILHISFGEESIEYYSTVEDFHGYTIGGLMGAVQSGYFLSATSVLALYNKESRISVLNWLAFIIIFMGLFFVQERSGLIASIICTILYISIVSLHEQRNLKTIILICLVATIAISCGVLQFFSFEDMRYSTVGMSDNKRISIATDAISWVLHNPIGGANFYYAMGGYYPHNVFVNALLYGGIIGGGILIGILFAQLLKIVQVFSAYYLRATYSPLLLVVCITYLCYTINSFFHNYSLVFGGEMIFLLWAMIGSLKDIEDYTPEDIDLETEEVDSGPIIEE